MNTLSKFFLVVGTGLSIALSINAQDAPSSTKKYSETQADELYKKHLMDRKRHIEMPANLSSVFQKDFPNARDVRWEESDVFYRADFEEGRLDYKAYYDKEGNLVLYKREISTNSLPSLVQNAIIAKYPNFMIDDAEIINKSNVATYEVKIEKGDLEYKLLLDNQGKILSEQID